MKGLMITPNNLQQTMLSAYDINNFNINRCVGGARSCDVIFEINYSTKKQEYCFHLLSWITNAVCVTP